MLTACRHEITDVKQAVLEPDTIVQKESNFRTTVITRGRYTDITQLSGTVIYFNSIELHFSEDNATFSQFLVESGNYVKEGDKLAECIVNVPEVQWKEYKLQQEAYNNELKERDILFADETAGLEQAMQGVSAEAKNVYELLIEKKKLEHRKQTEDLENDIFNLQKILQKRNQNDRHYIYAPMDGIIDKLGYINEGDSLDSERWVVMMHSEDESYIQVSDSKNQFYYNMPVTIEAGKVGNKISYEGIVVQADNVLSDHLKTQKAYIALKDSSIQLSGLDNIVVLAATKTAEDILIVDHNAVYTAKGKKYVVLLEDGIAKKRYITVGMNNSDYYCILDGAIEGWDVIIQ
jgi:multidrug efflux pump subunit AcrA (membrane-fusion protein)